jgi:mRNA interferase MazF
MSSTPLNRGDVVLVNVPYLDASQSVRRPALVVCEPKTMLDVVIAGITSRIRNPLPATHYAITKAHPDWPSAGLKMDSAVRCDRLFTIERIEVHRVLGRLSPATLTEIDLRLKLALGLS